MGGESSGHHLFQLFKYWRWTLFCSFSFKDYEAKPCQNFRTGEPNQSLAVFHWHSKSIRKPISQFENLQKYLRKVKSAYSEQARVLIRYSGTEPKIRILVEAIEEELKNDIFSNVQRLVSEHI